MTKPLRIDDEATLEIEEAFAWYEARDPKVAVRFMLAADEALVRIEEAPRAHPLAIGHVGGPPARRGQVFGFPYSIVFVDLAEELRVIAVAHHRRAPGYWRGRAGR